LTGERLLKIENELQIKNIEHQHLTSEILAQEENFAALVRDKKRLEASGERLMKQLGEEEDKNKFQNRARVQLQENLKAVEDALVCEKKDRLQLADILKRQESEAKALKVENEVLKSGIVKLEEISRKQEGEMNVLRSGGLDMEVKLGGMEKEVRRLAGDLEESQSVCEMEKAARIRSEKAKKELVVEMDDMRQKMQGACDANAVQIELNGRYESELAKLRCQMEVAVREGENRLILSGFRL